MPEGLFEPLLKPEMDVSEWREILEQCEMDHCFSQSRRMTYAPHGTERQVASVPLLYVGVFSCESPQHGIVPLISTSLLGRHLQEGRIIFTFTHHLSLQCLAQYLVYNRCSIDIFHCKNKTKGLLENKTSH